MSYQVYFSGLKEENNSLILAVLNLKEEADTLELGEAHLLAELRGPDYSTRPRDEPLQSTPEPRRAPYRRRRPYNGRSPRLNGS